MSDEKTTDQSTEPDVPSDESNESERSNSADGEEANDGLSPDVETGTLDYWKERSRLNERNASKAQRTLKKTEAEIERLRNRDEDETAKAVREAETAALSKANARILRSEIKAAAAGKLADATDALRLLDLDQFEVGEDGEIDEAEIASAITDLLKSKPYLAAQQNGKPRFQGGADQGARKKVPAKTVDEQISEAELAGNWPEARRLKTAKLAASNQ